jgi:cytochrome c biogenesis factor
MEFEEIQKIWNQQQGETMYTINETELHKTIMHHKDAAGKRINRVEIMLSLINVLLGSFLLVLAVLDSHLLNFINAGILLITVAYIQYFRWKRKKAENTFDRTMLGELNHALSNADSIIKFNSLMLIGYLLPLALVTISTLVVAGVNWEKCLLITAAFVVSFIILRWEQRAINVPSKEQLLIMKNKLMEE